MTKTVEEVRRELFEAWVKTFNSMPAALFQDERSRYIDDWIQCRWLGFNAALDAVVIEFPENKITFQTEERFNIRQSTIGQCRAAIEQTGLGLRIK